MSEENLSKEELGKLVVGFFGKMFSMESPDSVVVLASEGSNSQIFMLGDVMKAYGMLDYYRRETFVKMISEREKAKVESDKTRFHVAAQELKGLLREVLREERTDDQTRT